MVPPFDIFKVLENGSLRWLEPAATLKLAEARIAELARSAPGTYVIFSHATGHRVSIQSDGRKFTRTP